MISISDVDAAAEVVYAQMLQTEQIRWPLLSERVGADVWLKHENHTPVGSFKIRGALNYVAALRREEPGVSEIVAPTRGNHGQAVAFAAACAGVRATIVVPVGNCADKNRAMTAYGAELLQHGRDYQEACEFADTIAKQRSAHLVRSFTSTWLAGVATYCREFLTRATDLDVVYVPMGMGSGISAMILMRDLLKLKTKIIGVVAANAPAYALSFEAGAPVSTESAETIADGLACRVPNPQVVALIRRGAERIIRVEDDDIRRAIAVLFCDTHNIAEGAGAAALAGVMKERDVVAGKRVGAILSGGNLGRNVLRDVAAQLGRDDLI